MKALPERPSAVREELKVFSTVTLQVKKPIGENNLKSFQP